MLLTVPEAPAAASSAITWHQRTRSKVAQIGLTYSEVLDQLFQSIASIIPRSGIARPQYNRGSKRLSLQYDD
jgi:hypothetical protein